MERGGIQHSCRLLFGNVNVISETSIILIFRETLHFRIFMQVDYIHIESGLVCHAYYSMCTLIALRA